jgi:glycosyltransferase involved in cell wall biosynthesis
MGHLHRWDPSSYLSYLHPRLTCIICASDAVRNSLVELRVPRDRLRTIYKGHDPAWYQPARREALIELGVPGDAFVVGCAARIRPLKGIPVLIEALRRMRAPEAHLLLVGENDDPQVRDMAQAPELNARIHLVGRRDNAASLMGACDVFVMPSLRREGMPRAIIEAMSQGVPAVVSNIGGMPELVIDGECGRVVPVSDSTALADALNEIRLNPEHRASMGRRARERIQTAFSVQHTVEQTAALYRELVDAST